MSITAREVISTLQQYDNKDAVVLVYDDSNIYEIDFIDDTMDDQVDFNLVEGQKPVPTFNRHQTYNVIFAFASLKEGLGVYVDGSLSDEPDRKLNSLSEIADCEGHLLIIKGPP